MALFEFANSLRRSPEDESPLSRKTTISLCNHKTQIAFYFFNTFSFRSSPAKSTISVFDLHTHKHIKTISERSPIEGILWVPQKQTLLVALDSIQKVGMFDKNYTQYGFINTPQQGSPSCIAFNPLDSCIVTSDHW